MLEFTPIYALGKEKLRYTVVLTVRGDGQKVRPRIIYKGTPFVQGTNKSGTAKKPGKNSISYEHLPEKRTSFGYPAGGISLGVQKSSWCDGVQSDGWVTQDFMRRPGSTLRDQRPRVLVLDDFRCHREESFQKKLKDLAETLVVMLGGGLTPVCQPLDRNINKEFKRGFRAKYTVWIRDNFGHSGQKVSAPSRGLVATWVKEVWEGISERTIRSCFKVCGLTLNLDGSEDHAWCTSTFGDNYREILREQREEWEKAHGTELEPLQLPVIPTGDGVKDTVAEAAADLAASSTHQDDSDDEDGIEDIVDLAAEESQAFEDDEL